MTTYYDLFVCENCWNLHAKPDNDLEECAACGGHDIEIIEDGELEILINEL